MPVVSIINYKGGVGKTTVTANLAAELAFRGHDVLMVDLDPQSSLTFSFIKPDTWRSDLEKDKTIKAWFESFEGGTPLDLSTLILTPEVSTTRLKGKGRLDLIPSHLGLINVDLELATELGGGTIKQVQKKYLRVHRRLAQGLADIDDDAYDVVLIDCPPNFNVVTKNAIVASDFVLTPARPDNLSTMGIDYLIKSLNELISGFNDYAGDDVEEIAPEILGVVFTMIQEYGGQPISAQRPYIRQTKKLKIPVFKAYIKRNDSIFADAPENGVPVVLHNYSNASHSSVVNSMESFATEFIGKLGL